jgi:hypothetical protein
MAKSGYITILQNSQSIPNNTSNISVNGYVTTSGESYRGNHRTGTFNIYQGGNLIYTKSFTSGAPANTTTLLFSVTLTVSHNADGTSGAITASYSYDNGWATGSGSKSLSKIPRQATITSAPNFNDEQNPTITYSNPAGNAVSSVMACISFDTTKDDIEYREISKTDTSYTFNLTEEERNILRNWCANSKSKEVIFFVKTKIGESILYSTLKKTLTIVNAEPVLSAVVEDVNETTLAVTGDKNIIVKYLSDAQYNMTASALKGATIKTYNVTCGNKNSGKQSGIMYGVESSKFVFSVTDSRGYVSTFTVDKTFCAYEKLTCVLKTHTPTAEGSMEFDVAGNAFLGSFGLRDNIVDVQYRYRSENDENYGNWKSIDDVRFSDGKYTAFGEVTGLDYTLGYTIQARIVDSLSFVISSEHVIRVKPVFYWGKDKFFFNVPINVMGFDQDYIVAQGTDGIWTYRKWASGISECWGKENLENVDCGANNYSGFYYSNGISIAFPSELFIENPVTSFEGGSQSFVNLIRDFGSSKFSAYFIVVGHMDTTANVAVKMHAKGRWK